jgi:hypothetical protein
MRFNQSRVLVLISVLLLASSPAPVSASTLQLVIAEDKNSGYKRSAFKHWIDADRNGCNTRAEVLIAEAIVKPKIGPKCKLTGGKWISAYDGKTITNASKLDVDHLVPLAEAWRSGAWNWSAKKRQDFANDLVESRSLIAVTLSTNRSKGDKDPALWMPSQTQCSYVSSWIAVKWRFDLTVDRAEASTLKTLITDCGFTNVIIGESDVVPSNSPTPITSAAPTPILTPKSEPTPTPTPTSDGLITSTNIIKPGTFCSPAGATGKSSSGVTYTCKTSATDTRNRWRQ